MEYYLVTLSYNSKGGVHNNTSLAKAASFEMAEKGVKDDALKQGLKNEDIISVEAHRTIDCTNTCL